ncbi:16S rRNA (cytosine(967)-C(5))-methyltransferase RsmB [Streptococcus iniae]|uniref:16S rRNA (cytosine(967)-C(5))-methyltransferase n=1 Tax=Streptococcus iniae TaxID=1346 RepID=A0A1J0N0H2_STRIN|nr:16S rRNA (cytosine(967)-C(5))-methyltransferase RsmB [Streptococcus iniae]AGM99407.1 16S rRNA m(5)C 967 methyltransferase [Streptococcus iniae SF1]AHY16338.1 16S rRNA methyltransferase [Streptococcus iniae]AHY18201.1 16S rRNA methyltransferase [Streptococcus iniae]AJG26487.1 16S rRNA methyltransferase [Streptococcus iniae]APD32363.1 16S rRNA (cytosine(967)-C(5))-methyltransferase [Streptococcus iniae]
MANNWKQLPRGKALIVLEDVFENGAYSGIALNHQLSNNKLSPKDKGFITEIVYGTISRKITLEWYLSHVVTDRDKLDKWVYYLLMLSLYQLVYLDKVPKHAIVNEAVNIAKNRGNKRGAEKYVNAILRQLTASDLPDYETIKRQNKRYSIKYSLPTWLVKKLMDQFGETRALAIMESLLETSKASIRVTDENRLMEIKEALGAQESVISPLGLTKTSANFATSDYFTSGAITIQDESSQLVAPTLQIEGHEHILDACSAPGGKTLHMASYLSSGRVTALDIYQHKLDLVKENAKRLGLTDKIETRQLDARKVNQTFPADSFDKILVDAPCSGIGLMRRKPDIKYNKEIQDFEQLQGLQLEILASVCQTVRKGGIITYSTCTIFDEENFQVVEKFLQSHSNFEQVKLNHTQEDIVKDGCLYITPEQYQTDGFFISQFRRVL